MPLEGRGRGRQSKSGEGAVCSSTSSDASCSSSRRFCSSLRIVFLLGQARTDYAEQKLAGSATSGNLEDYEAQLERTREQLGLDGPLWKRYIRYVGNVLQGDFGESYITKVPVTTELKDRLPASLELGLAQLLIGVTIAMPIGVISAIRQDTWLDYVLRVFAILGLAIPVFFPGAHCCCGCRSTSSAGRRRSSRPRTGRSGRIPVVNLKMMSLPAIAGGLAEAAIIMRLLRSQLLEVLRQDYVRTAWAKGLRERTS